MNKILFLDTETGGLNPYKHSLLSVAFCLWVDGKLIPSKEWYLKADAYVVTSEAIALNKIDITKLDEVGVTKVQFVNELDQWLVDSGVAAEDFPLILGGHNVNFDVAFLVANFGEEFMKRFSHRVVDTVSILRFLCDTGNLPPALASGSSGKAMDFFKLSKAEDRHSALVDATSTAELYSRLIELVK